MGVRCGECRRHIKGEAEGSLWKGVPHSQQGLCSWETYSGALQKRPQPEDGSYLDRDTSEEAVSCEHPTVGQRDPEWMTTWG